MSFQQRVLFTRVQAIAVRIRTGMDNYVRAEVNRRQVAVTASELTSIEESEEKAGKKI